MVLYIITVEADMEADINMRMTEEDMVVQTVATPLAIAALAITKTTIQADLATTETATTGLIIIQLITTQDLTTPI
jgi:hypothetical protein